MFGLYKEMVPNIQLTLELRTIMGGNVNKVIQNLCYEAIKSVKKMV